MAPVALDKIRDVPFWDDPRRHCLGKDTALFFPANYNASAVSPALRLCNGDNGPPCPVLAACATWALTHPGHGGASYGIWGGMTVARREDILAAIRHLPRGTAARRDAIAGVVRRHLAALKAIHA